ncbi:MAG: serine/threonine protein kinase [Phycisphaerae bacterium]|nr:serine/threonine protein kinase [Phycisphaerae bacterium]
MSTQHPRDETQSLRPDIASADATLSLPQGNSLPSALPAQIGQYRIVRAIASGGMGTVYEAEQQSPKRTVALKVIRHGLTTPALLRRFELESQVLGRLQHPGIAQIYEAGFAETESGTQPFFAMEYVRGEDLRKYVNRTNLSTRQRLDLIARICDAVHHAHQKGVIHRDLKPGNILVDASGQPKILDFGVARATDSDMQVTTMQTDVGQLIGTIQYMSPEQVAADPNQLDTRSDVYSLGVIAFEILTGRPPYDLKNKMIHEAARIIREEELTRLSTFNRTLRGDVETIVGRALEKEKERRYPSAAGLAEDIRRYLADEPILARPPSAIYQLQKFAKRNKALATGLAIAMAALLVGMFTSTALYLRAENARRSEQEQRERAEKTAKELEVVTEFQQSMLTGIDAEAMGRRIVNAQRAEIRTSMENERADAAQIEAALASFDKSVKGMNATDLALKVVDENVLARAVETIDEQFAEQPITRASLQQVVADTYQFLGLHDPAIPLQEAALHTRRRELGDRHPDTLTSVSALGALLKAMGKLDEAETYHREAMVGRRRTLGEGHPSTITSITNMGSLLSQMGKYSEAEPYYKEALEASRHVLGNDHPRTLLSINNMGSLLFRMGKYTEAEPLLREAVEGRRRVLGNDHPHTMISINNLGGLLARMGKFAEAEPYLQETLDGSRRELGDYHPSTLTLVNNMGFLFKRMGRLADAELYFRKALEGRRQTLGDAHPSTLNTVNNMGALLSQMGKDSQAEPYYREALDGFRRVLGDDHPQTLESTTSMATWLTKMTRFAEAEPLLREALNHCRRKYGDDNPRTTEVVNHLIMLYDAWHAAEPDQGYDAEAAEWRAKLEEVEASTDSESTEEP